MRPGAVPILLGVLLLAGARSAAAQGPSDEAGSVPGKSLYFGVAAEGLVSGSPGLAIGGIAAIEWERLLIVAEAAFGETFSKWDAFRLGGQAGAVLLSTANAPYLLAGVDHGIFVDVIGERRGRTDTALTGEAGYMFRRLNGGRQIWLGVRGIAPIGSHVYSSAAPQLPLVVLTARFLL